MLSFVIDTAGRALPESVRVLYASHWDFIPVATEAVVSCRYRPPAQGVPVRVTMPISFTIHMER